MAKMAKLAGGVNSKQFRISSEFLTLSWIMKPQRHSILSNSKNGLGLVCDVNVVLQISYNAVHSLNARGIHEDECYIWKV